MAAIWKGAKAIEKVNVTLMVSLFILLFSALFLSFVMDLKDGTLDGFVYMFSMQPGTLVNRRHGLMGYLNRHGHVLQEWVWQLLIQYTCVKMRILL